jgi:hypothetical protein
MQNPGEPRAQARRGAGHQRDPVIQPPRRSDTGAWHCRTYLAHLYSASGPRSSLPQKMPPQCDSQDRDTDRRLLIARVPSPSRQRPNRPVIEAVYCTAGDQAAVIL